MTEQTRESNVESESPRSLLERACDTGLAAAETFLRLRGVEGGGVEGVRIFMTIHAEGQEPHDSASGGYGYDDATELVGELLGAASGMARELGFTMHVVPKPVRGGRG